MRHFTGMRVGAVLSADDAEVQFLGYGVYQGDEKPPGDLVFLGGLMQDMYDQHPEFERDHTNPKILLDNGDVVWGCECWGGPEDEIKKRLTDGRKIVEVRIGPIRDEARQEIVARKEAQKKLEDGE